MLERMGRVIDWLCFGLIGFAVYVCTINSNWYTQSMREDALGVVIVCLFFYIIMQVLMYIIRGKVRILPWR